MTPEIRGLFVISLANKIIRLRSNWLYGRRFEVECPIGDWPTMMTEIMLLINREILDEGRYMSLQIFVCVVAR